MKSYLVLCLCLIQAVAFGQSQTAYRISSGLDLGVALKSQYTSPSLAYYQLLNIGPRKLLSVGYTAKYASFYGDNLTYETAPARLRPDNIDRVYFGYVTINSFNFGVRAQLHVSIIDIGASADVLGIAFGKGRGGIYQSLKGQFKAGTSADGKDSLATFTGDNAFQRASPSNASLRLFGDNNLGTLSSEVYVRLHINQRVAVKVGYQWLTSEMTTNKRDVVANNDRFRNTTSMPYFAVTFPFF
jgi:hypothetical protein